MKWKTWKNWEKTGLGKVLEHSQNRLENDTEEPRNGLAHVACVRAEEGARLSVSIDQHDK